MSVAWIPIALDLVSYSNLLLMGLSIQQNTLFVYYVYAFSCAYILMSQATWTTAGIVHCIATYMKHFKFTKTIQAAGIKLLSSGRTVVAIDLWFGRLSQKIILVLCNLLIALTPFCSLNDHLLVAIMYLWLVVSRETYSHPCTETVLSTWH